MARSTIRDLIGRLQKIESERDEAQDHLDEAQALFERLQLQVDGYKAVIADQEAYGVGVGVEPVSSQVLHDEMEKILHEWGEPLHRKVIYQSLTESGIKVGGNDPVANTGAHLSSDDRFVSVGDGEWGLKIWPKPSANNNHSGDKQQDALPEPSAALTSGDIVWVPDDSGAPDRYLGLFGEVKPHEKVIDREGKWYWIKFDALDSTKVYQIKEDWIIPVDPPD